MHNWKDQRVLEVVSFFDNLGACYGRQREMNVHVSEDFRNNRISSASLCAQVL